MRALVKKLQVISVAFRDIVSDDKEGYQNKHDRIRTTTQCIVRLEETIVELSLHARGKSAGLKRKTGSRAKAP